MRESQREDLTLYKEFANPELYAKVMDFEDFRIRSSARSIYVRLSTKYDLPDDTTSAYLRRVDANLKEHGVSLSEIVNNELMCEIQKEDNFEKEKDTEEFKKAYADYLANYDKIVID